MHRFTVLLGLCLLGTAAAQDAPASAQPDLTRALTLADGQRAVGQLPLASGLVLNLEDGQRYIQPFAYVGSAGERVTLTVNSAQFMPMAALAEGPVPGAVESFIEYADPGSGSVSLQLTLPVDGRYLFVAGTREVGAEGQFIVALEAEPALPPELRFGAMGGSPSDRYALLVGVNDYPGDALDPRDSDDLPNPALNLEVMRELLVDHYGFRPEHVVTLLDADATRDNVVAAFRTLLASAGPDGSALFYFNGHGVQVPDSLSGPGRGDEADGTDEALVLRGGGGRYALLLDEELGFLADELSTDNVVFMLDNCYAGTGTRGAEDLSGLVREHRVSWETVADRTEAVDGAVLEQGSSAATSTGATGEDRGPSRHVLIAAGSPDQTTLAIHGYGKKGGWGTPFLHYLDRFLREADPDDPLSSVMTKMRPEVERATLPFKREAGEVAQTPQIEGFRSDAPIRAFFGSPVAN